MFKPSQYWDIVISDIGVIFWAIAVGAAIYTWGFADVFRVYLAPYLWYLSYFSLFHVTANVLTNTSCASRQGQPLAHFDHVPPAH